MRAQLRFPRPPMCCLTPLGLQHFWLRLRHLAPAGPYRYRFLNMLLVQFRPRAVSTHTHTHGQREGGDRRLVSGRWCVRVWSRLKAYRRPPSVTVPRGASQSMKNESAKKGKNKKRASPTDLIAEGLELLQAPALQLLLHSTGENERAKQPDWRWCLRFHVCLAQCKKYGGKNVNMGYYSKNL